MMTASTCSFLIVNCWNKFEEAAAEVCLEGIAAAVVVAENVLLNNLCLIDLALVFVPIGIAFVSLNTLACQNYC